MRETCHVPSVVSAVNDWLFPSTEVLASDLLVLVRSALLLVHTMGSCDYPLTVDDGASTGVTVAVVEADLPGPPAQRGLDSPNYPGQFRTCPAL